MVKHSDEKVSGVAELGEAVRQLPRRELLGRIRQVEDAVHRGTAQMRDYETFVSCQEELLRRELVHSSWSQASKP